MLHVTRYMYMYNLKTVKKKIPKIFGAQDTIPEYQRHIILYVTTPLGG